MNPLLLPSGVRPTGETNTYRVESGSRVGVEHQVVLLLGCDCEKFRMGKPARVRRENGGRLVFPGGVCQHYAKAAYVHGLLSAEALLRLEGNKHIDGP